MGFDPSQPFEAVAVEESPSFDPSQPYEVVATAEFDPGQPFEVLDVAEEKPAQSPAPSFTATMPVKIGQPIGTPQDFTTFDPNKFLTAQDSPTPSQSVDTGLYKISYAKAAPTNAVPALNPINGEWTPEVIASQNARADEFNPPTESALRERSYNEVLNPLFQLTQGPLKPQAPRKLTEDEWWASKTPRVEAFEPKTFTGEIGKGDIPGAIGVAYKAARESLEPFFGPTEEQFNNEKVPWGTNPDGSVKYEYKPLGSRLDKTGLLMTPLLETKMMEPKSDDTSLDAAGKATFNFMAGLVNFGLSGLGIATVGLGGATKAATRIAGFAPAGLGAEGSVAAQTAARLAATARVVSGGFAIDMAYAVPEQYKAATESPTLQGRIEGWLGTVSSLAFATLAAKHAAKKPLELAERQTLESVVELAKRTPDAVLEAVARNMEADVYSRNLAKAELQRRQIEQQAALAPEAAAAAEAAGPAIPSGTAGPPAWPNRYGLKAKYAAEPPDPAATAVGVIKTAAAADAAGKPLEAPKERNAPGTKAGGLTHTEVVLDSELGTQKIEVKDGDTVVGYIAFGNDLNGYDTINMVWVKPEYRGKGISTELYRRALASAKERGRKGLASTDASLHTPEKTKSTRRNFIVRESTDKADTKKALELSGKLHYSVHFIEGEKASSAPVAKPTPAPSPAPAAQAAAPVVGERVKVEPTKPKGPEPTAEQTLNEALEANRDLPSAWKSLDNQVKALEGDKANKATVARLEAAKRKIANTLEEEHQRSERAQVEEQETGKYDLLESVKQLGKLPSATSKHAKEAVGELKRIKESSKGATTSLFSKDAGSLDTLREGLAERGFQFDTYFQMLEAIEAANTSGKSVLGSQFPEGYRGGPGAMGPVERAQFEAERKIFQSAQEPIQQRRVSEQRGDREEWLRRSDPDRMAEAEAIMERDPKAGQKLVDSINAGETKSATDVQELILARELIDQYAARDAAAERLADPDPTITPTERAFFDKEFNAANERIGKTEDASDKTGSEKGAAFRMRRMMIADDYSLQGLSRKERKIKGRDLTPEEVEALKKIADKYKKAQAELDLEREARQKLDESAAMEAVVVEMERELEAAAKTGATYHPSVMQHAKEIVERAKGEAADAWKRIRSQMGSESGAVGGVGGPKGEGKKLGQPTRQQIAAQNRATLINDVALILKARVYEFGVKMAEAAQYVLLRSGDMGDSIRPILARAVAKANTMMERELNTRPQKVKEAVKTGATAPEKQPKAKPTPESYIDKGKASVVAGDDPLYRKEIGEAIDGGNVTVETHKLMSSARRLVYDIVTAHWENGVRGTDALMEAALKTVQEFLPDATLRDVHRAYGEYGKVKFPNKDALSMQLSAAYRETKLMEDIARMEKDDKDALRRGFTPEKPNLRQRELAQKRAELQKLRQGKPSPEKLAGIQQARQTAVKNRMEVLDKMLKNGEKPPVGSKVADDVFTEQLKSEKQAMQDLWNEIEAAKNPPPPEHIAELAKLQDRADILRDRLARMELTQPKAEGKQTVDTAEIAAAKAEIKQLSDTMTELRKPVPLSDAQKALDSALVARERAGQTLDDISTGKVKDPAKIKEALTQLEEDVRLETDALKALAAEMRRDAKPKGDPGYLKEQAQIKSLERAIASYAEKVAKGDLAGKGKAQGPDSQRVTQLKAIRDSRQAAYQAAKNLGKPVLSPEQRYNATRLKALTKREADLRADIAAGRFAAKPKKVNPALDKATIDAELKVDAVKQEYLKSQFDWQKKQRNKPTIAKDAAMEAFSLARATMLSVDLGFMGLQLGTRLITNPLLVLKNMPAAIKAGWGGTGTGRGWARLTGNERALDAVNKSIELRPEAKNGDLKQMGIVTSTSALKTEYALRGRLADYIPLVAQSNRAMTAALNLVRADLARASIEAYGQGFPIDAKTLKMLGNEINIVTGKGALGKAEIHRAMLNHFGLAPGWVISRFQFLYGQPVWEALLKGDKKAAGMFFRSYVKWAAGSLTLLSTAAFFHGDDWDEFKARLDPRSSRFGMIPIGNRIYDFSSGIIGPLVFLSRFTTGERVTKDGEVISLRREDGKPKKFGTKSTTDLAFKFAQGKAAPIPGFILDLASGEDVVGRPANFATALLNRTLPLTPRQMAQIASEEGIPGSVIPALLQFMGVNSRNEDTSIEEGMDYDPVFQIADKLGVDPR